EQAVAPLPAAELARADDALELEPGLRQRLLLGDVLRMGTGLNSLGRRVLEQVFAQRRLGAPADPSPPPLREECDADLPAGRRPAVLNRAVAHEPGPLVVGRDDEP